MWPQAADSDYPANGLDNSSNGFGSADAYGLPSFMDTSVPHDESMPAGQPGLSFSDYTSTGSFDVGGFGQELGLSGTPGPSSDPEQEQADVPKTEPVST